MADAARAILERAIWSSCLLDLPARGQRPGVIFLRIGIKPKNPHDLPRATTEIALIKPDLRFLFA